MLIRLFSIFLFVILQVFAISAQAQIARPPLNRPIPGDRPNIGDRVDRDRWEEGGAIFNNYPPETYSQETEEARREKERLQQEAAREKAEKSHSDPGGGFFNPDQYPKGNFN